jgi:hypothetical protein
MSHAGLTVPDMTGPLRCYDVTVTVNHDGSPVHRLAGFEAAVRQATSRRDTGIMWAHTGRQLISVVTVPAADQPGAAAITLAVAAEALAVWSCRPAADGTAAAGLVR